MELSETQSNNIADKIVIKLESSRSLSSQKHDVHHKWVDDKIDSEKETRKARKRIFESSLIWALPIALGFIATAVWKAAHGG